MLVLLCLGFWVPVGAALAAGPANRYLLIVDTSRAMQRRAEGTLKVVQDLLDSRMGGQMHPGDTLGIWTFNATLSAGQFPLQTWSLENQPAISGRVIEFLKSQTCEKTADFTPILPALEHVIQNSELLTVILVTAGDAKFEGTPFDETVNEFLAHWRDEQQKARMPFVMLLRASKGKFTNYAMSPAPWPLEFPALPQLETKVVQAAKPPAPAPPPPVVQKAPPPTAQPLIFSGKKPSPEDSGSPKAETPQSGLETPLPSAVTVAAPTAPVEQAPILTNAAAQVQTAPPTTTIPPLILSGKKSQPESAGSSDVATPPTKPEAASISPVAAPAVATLTNTIAQVQADSSSSAASTVPVAPEPSRAAVAAQQPDQPVPPAVRAPESGTSASQPAASDSHQIASKDAGAPSPAGKSETTPWSLWVGCFLGAGGFGCIIMLLLRRSRAAASSSLITMSLERVRR